MAARIWRQYLAWWWWAEVARERADLKHERSLEQPPAPSRELLLACSFECCPPSCVCSVVVRFGYTAVKCYMLVT